VEWILISLGVLGAVAVAIPIGLHLYVVWKYIPVVIRIFQEKPLFILPFGQPTPDAEEVTLTTPDGLALQGCYLPAHAPRKGVLLFGIEFGSNRWSCVPYCEFLREAGYDIFSFEMRGQGKSPAQPGYEPLQWVTDFEVTDYRTALAYLKNRADRHPGGVGLFGLSKGASAALIAAANDDFVRCFSVDGIFASVNTMVPYMAQWVMIYTTLPWIAKFLPNWYLGIAAHVALRRMERERHCHYPSLEAAMPKLAPRPLLMIHGSADNYIKPAMARSLFERAREPKELWLVDKAKHNQSFALAADEYKRRVLAFFDKHLAGTASETSACGLATSVQR
jgi:fermentation-respiration switch protein FrsA (DUF1100 family)